MARKNCWMTGEAALAFAVGLLLASICPLRLTVILLSVAIVLLGVSFCR